MTAARLLRGLASIDVATGAGALLVSSWLADQVDVGVTPVRVVAALLVVLGVETYLLADRPVMTKVRIATEAVCSLLAVDLAIVGDPTGVGTALLVGTALWCAAVTVELVLTRSVERSGSTARSRRGPARTSAPAG